MHEEKSKLHHDALLSCALLQQTLKNRKLQIDECFAMQRSELRQIIKSSFSLLKRFFYVATKTFHYGDIRDDATNMDDGNPGTFRALLDFRIQAGDAVLQ